MLICLLSTERKGYLVLTPCVGGKDQFLYEVRGLKVMMTLVTDTA